MAKRLALKAEPATAKRREEVHTMIRLAITFAAGAAVALAAVLVFGALQSDSNSTASADAHECLTALDFSNDGVVDVNDVVALRQAIEIQDLDFDFNGDGTVDIYDAIRVAQAVLDCLGQNQPPVPGGSIGP
jgi:hypothetical protein